MHVSSHHRATPIYPKIMIGIGVITLLVSAILGWQLSSAKSTIRATIILGGSLIGIALIVSGAICIRRTRPSTSALSFSQSLSPAQKRAVYLQTNHIDPNATLKGMKRTTALGSYSFIQTEHPEAITAITTLLDSSTPLPPLLNSILGILVGGSIGDASFAQYEKATWLPHNKDSYVNHRDHFLKGASVKGWTDDTAMTLCLIDIALQNQGKFDGRQAILAFRDWWMHNYNGSKANELARGIGGRSKAALEDPNPPGREEKGEYHSTANTGSDDDQYNSSNGPLMRLPPPMGQSVEEVLADARSQSYSTHKGHIAAECAAFQSFILYRMQHCTETDPAARKGAFFAAVEEYGDKYLFDLILAYDEDKNEKTPEMRAKQEARLRVDALVKKLNHKGEDWNWTVENFAFHPTRIRPQSGTRIEGNFAMDALAMSLHCIYSTNSFTDAVILAGSRGGDADTLATVTGKLAGAIYGYEGMRVEWGAIIDKIDSRKEIRARAYLIWQLLLQPSV